MKDNITSILIYKSRIPLLRVDILLDAFVCQNGCAKAVTAAGICYTAYRPRPSIQRPRLCLWPLSWDSVGSSDGLSSYLFLFSRYCLLTSSTEFISRVCISDCSSFINFLPRYWFTQSGNFSLLRKTWPLATSATNSMVTELSNRRSLSGLS